MSIGARTFTSRGPHVDRVEAEKALGIIRQVIQNTRDDLIAHNWGLIWMIHSFTNFVGTACGTLIDRRGLPVYWYLVPLGVLAVVNIAIVQLLVTRDRGVRSFVEWQIHGIWVNFIIFTIAAVGVLYLGGARPTLFGPLFAMTSGIGFAMMGVVFYRKFLGFAALFLLLMPVAAQWPEVQWWLIGAAWWAAMFIPGLAMFRERKRRLAEGGDTRIL
jgi:hypothetical protein